MAYFLFGIIFNLQFFSIKCNLSICIVLSKWDFADMQIVPAKNWFYKLFLLHINLSTSFTVPLSFPSANLLSICILLWQ